MPTRRRWGIYGRLLEKGQASGTLAGDAHLAAPAVDNGAILCTTDMDFRLFSGLRRFNALSLG